MKTASDLIAMAKGLIKQYETLSDLYAGVEIKQSLAVDLAKAVIESIEGAEIVRWQRIESAPKDGREFVTSNMNQGGVKRLVWWDKLHETFVVKGTPISMHETHWADLPQGPQ